MRIAAAVMFLAAAAGYLGAVVWMWPRYSYRNNRRAIAVSSAVLAVGLALLALAG